MSSPFFGEQRKTRHNRSCSSCDSLPRYAASPPCHPQYAKVDRAAPSVSSPTFSSVPPSPKFPALCMHAMSHTNSTVPSSKLPFSNSVTGNGAALIGTLASFDSEAPRGRPASVAEDGAASGSSSGLSRAAVLMSGRGDASPPFSPQPSGSVLAVFCPLTSKAWQSGTLRDGIAFDVDTTSKVSTISPQTGLQSPLLFSSGWSQQSVSAAAQGTPPSFMGTPGQSLISAGAEGDDAEDTPHSCGAMYSPNHSVSLLPAPKVFVSVYPVQSPEPFATKFTGSPVFEVSLTTPPSIRAPQTGAARGAGATPAPSSRLPSESLEQYSLLRSPILHSLTPLSISPSAPLSPGFGCITGTEPMQSRLSRHRLATSAGSEQLPVRTSNDMRSRNAAVASPPPAAVPSVNSNHESLSDRLVSPARRSYRCPLPSSNEASLSSFFAVDDAGLHANLSMTQASEEDAAHRAASATLPRVCSSKDTEAEEGVAAALAPDTTDDPFEAFWDISPAAQWGGSVTEMLPRITTSSAPFETGSASRSVTAFASGTHEKDSHSSEEFNQNNRLSCVSMERHRNTILHRPSAAQQRNTILHRPSVVQQRNSVNRSVDTQRTTSKTMTLQQRQRRFSLQQEDSIEIKRRSYA
ncbi:hypothetical protein LMJF_34_0175 [Leishmania major strain Friedlin]|uniref:Uncharacterized protein n=1 Tax=Leishmania major TaxID=5664 RepID=E9AEH6_LEIMA|nr:hypothetical protein LMJF_34_0175 [Leishmania major strain Friedlin]CAG9581737.1 hypothetical_protein_-_conserved [Leishmania major strain Friedlin]CBZ05893.1 hypothetical protein LMJF_34_0175 [Leishmania major strain Friedlin]|eukprot:XP_003722396.1 hypothetical protein LMJF_34_0175 [Leishmania major strain Friedlin]